jgi:hypothetical protein
MTSVPRGDMPYHSVILKHIARQTKRIQEAEQGRDEMIREAFLARRRKHYGYTVDDIAEAAGLSRPRIYQIVEEAKDRD